jgi:hypothetical protein
MRSVAEIKRDLESLRYEIKLAQREYTSDRELEVMYNDLDELEEELYNVQSYELSLARVR